MRGETASATMVCAQAMVEEHGDTQEVEHGDAHVDDDDDDDTRACAGHGRRARVSKADVCGGARRNRKVARHVTSVKPASKSFREENQMDLIFVGLRLPLFAIGI